MTLVRDLPIQERFNALVAELTDTKSEDQLRYGHWRVTKRKRGNKYYITIFDLKPGKWNDRPREWTDINKIIYKWFPNCNIMDPAYDKVCGLTSGGSGEYTIRIQ